MDRRELNITSRTWRQIPKGYPWRRGESFFNRDISPLINYLQRESTPYLETSVKNYLIVRMVSILEDFFKTLVSQMVDNYNPSLSLIFKKEANIPIAILDDMLGGSNTGTKIKGRIIADQFNLTNPKHINYIFTALLQVDDKFRDTEYDFFRAIKKIDWYDPLKIFK